CVELQELLRHLAQRRAHRLLHALPRGTAEAIELRRRLFAAEVLRDELEALDRQVELVALRILEQEEVALLVADLHGLEPEVAADAVVLVDDEVVDRQIRERGERGTALVLRPAQRPAARAEDLVLGEHDEAEGGNREAARALAHDDGEAIG